MSIYDSTFDFEYLFGAFIIGIQVGVVISAIVVAIINRKSKQKIKV